MKTKKLRGSALQLTILISVVVALLLSSFLLLTYNYQFFNIQSDQYHQVIDNSNQGITYSLDPANNFTDSIQLVEDNIELTIIKKEFWGGFTKIESNASTSGKSFSKIALTGAKMYNQRKAIYLSETQQPLVLAGDTKIVGDIIVSDKGIKAGVISGNYFNEKTLLSGSIKATNGILPELDPSWTEYCQSLLNYTPDTKDNVVMLEGENTHSFLESAKIIFDREQIIIGKKIIGNCIVRSLTEIIVTSHAQLQDILLVAPKITIESGFKGNVHALSDENILIEENVNLVYPSSLSLIKADNQEKTIVEKGKEPIVISDGSMVSGTVIYQGTYESRNDSNTAIWLQPSSLVKGEVYCSGNVELSGSVHGSIYANKFVVNEFGSKYLNHIFNGKVLSDQLIESYSGLPFLSETKSIVQWLY